MLDEFRARGRGQGDMPLPIPGNSHAVK